MGKKELIQKLKESMNPEGLFTVSGKNSSTINEVQKDNSLSREDKINLAIEIFENSLEHKPKEATKVYLAF